MKPWNKIKWQKENVKLANKPLDDFDAWMKEICPIHGVRRWDCISLDHKQVSASLPSDKDEKEEK